MTTSKMIGKGLLLIVSAPFVMIGVVLAIFPTLIVKMIQLLINHSNTPKAVAQPEDAPRLMPEKFNLVHVVS